MEQVASSGAKLLGGFGELGLSFPFVFVVYPSLIPGGIRVPRLPVSFDCIPEKADFFSVRLGCPAAARLALPLA